MWLDATRPRTLAAVIAPVVMGIGIAVHDGAFHALSAAAAVLGALLIQVGTNFANDYFDFVKGADTGDRLGPPRATQGGLVAPRAMKRAFVLTFAAAVLVGVYLVLRGGWPIVGIGLTSVAAGILYTGGPRPLGYMGWGDVMVLIYFGPVAVGGTYFVQAGTWSADALVAGLAPGGLATALLTVNNLRDVDTDRVSGKRTLAVRFGRGFAKSEYAFCLALAAATPIAQWIGTGGPAPALAASAVCLLGLPALVTVARSEPGDGLLSALQATMRVSALYGVAFALGWMVARG